MDFTRIMYCKACLRARRPNFRDMFMDYNSLTNSYNPVLATPASVKDRYGLVPHLVTLRDRIGNMIMFDAICAMDGCGIYIQKEINGRPLTFTKDGYRIFFQDFDSFYINKKGETIFLEEGYQFFYHFKILKDPTSYTFSPKEWEAFTNYVDADLEL